jgi:hypothetical protein
MKKVAPIWRCHDPIEVWDWMEVNCPKTTIEAIGGLDSGQAYLQPSFGDEEEEVLFRLRWTMPGYGSF